jgi:uncharacterized protein (TIGR00369 family)
MPVVDKRIPEISLEVARAMLHELFAPWVVELDLVIESFETAPPADAAADWQPGVIVRMPFSERLCRQGAMVSGQAMMALADTSIALAIAAAAKGFPPIATVDQTSHFLKAAVESDLLADARVVRLGRSLSFGRATLFNANDRKPVAMVSSAFAML